MSSLLMLPALLNTISVTAVSPIVAAFYGLGVAGYFSFATRLLAVPSSLFGQAVGTVFFPRIAEIERAGGDASAVVSRATSSLVSFAVACFAPIALLGPQVFSLLFGEAWRPAGVVAALMTPWLAASFVSSPLSSVATVKGRYGSLTLLAIAETSVRLLGLACGTVSGDPVLGVIGYSAAGLAICVFYVGWTLRLTGSSLGGWARSERSYLAGSTVLLLALVAAKAHLPLPVFVGCVASAEVWWAMVALKRLRPVRRP